MLRTTLLSICSLLFVACAGGPQRPDTNIYQIIVSDDGMEAYGYNMLRDYDSEGNLKPDAKPVVIPLSSLKDLRKWYGTDPTGMKNLKVYLKDVRNYAKEHCK